MANLCKCCTLLLFLEIRKSYLNFFKFAIFVPQCTTNLHCVCCVQIIWAYFHNLFSWFYLLGKIRKCTIVPRAKVAKKYIFFFFFFLSFWVKHDSCDVYFKYELIQNRICERHFLTWKVSFWKTLSDQILVRSCL